MLKELQCDIFRTQIVKFHKGLNVIQGADDAANSIGKSSFLMVLDFVYGGNTYITANHDVVQHLGHHDFRFCYEFSDEKFYFIRGTANPKIVSMCDDKYKILSSIGMDDYTEWLKSMYRMDIPYISFRAITSTFSRIWGKNNYDLKKPLHQDPRQKNKDVILNLIKLFNKYESIRFYEEEIKNLTERKKAAQTAIRNDYLPRITKRRYEQNLKAISDFQQEIEELKKDIVKIDWKDIVNEEIVALKNERSALTRQKDSYENRLNRTQNNIQRKNSSLAAQFNQLTHYFPGVNLEKLFEIEQFHNSISSILVSELHQLEEELHTKIKFIMDKIIKIDATINDKLNLEDTPNPSVDKIVEFSTRINQIRNENLFYEKQQQVVKDIEDADRNLLENKSSITSDVGSLVNNQMNLLNNEINIMGRRAPVIEIHNDTYVFHVFDDTGTGKAYVSLLTFDIAIFRLTKVPILIHDTLLFKNVENGAIQNIVKLYNAEEKQVFISIDEVSKFNEITQEILTSQAVLRLSHEKTLFIKDWKNN